MASTDQTDITYVRPGTEGNSWQASAGIPGIDAKHTFIDPGKKPDQGPDTTPGSIPTRGPSAVTKAPAQNSRSWWQWRNRSRIALDEAGNNSGGQWSATVDEPQNNTQKPIDPRKVAIPMERWTGRTGPVLMALMHRVSEGQMAGVDRFNPNPGTNFAFTPSQRPSPMAFGDGRPNVPRFRTTQRVMPAPLDQQIVSDDQSGTVSGGVLGMGGTLSQRWW